MFYRLAMKIPKRTPDGKVAFKVFRTDGYDAYLRSKWWRSLKTRLASGLCTGCAESAAGTLHHVTYQRLGCERPTDMVALCHGCHMRLHDFLSERWPDLSRGKTAVYTWNVWSKVFHTPYPHSKQAKRAKRGRPTEPVPSPWNVCSKCFTISILSKAHTAKQPACWRCGGNTIVAPYQIGLSADGTFAVCCSVPNSALSKPRESISQIDSPLLSWE